MDGEDVNSRALPEAAICHADGPAHARDAPSERADRDRLSTRILKDRQLYLKVTRIFMSA